MLTGENGILTQATNAREKTTKAEEEEKIKMAVMGSSVDNNGYVDILDETSFKNELANQFGNQSLDVIANGDGSFIITIEDTQRKYYVNDDKTVINSDNIIEIGTAGELEELSKNVKNGNTYEGKAILLTDNIDLNGENWTPIGTYSEETPDDHYLDVEVNKPFKGIFDGCNNTINNLQINSTEDCQGLFGLVIDGTIRDITIAEGSSVTAGSRSGVIVGCLYGFSGNISNCVNNADGTGGGIVGIIAGQHTIFNCKNYGIITGSGGIVGSSNGTDWEQFINVSNTIINCGNYGSITRESGNNCGGIVGYLKGNIINCCNKAEINCNGNWSGGIVGGCDGKLENVYNLNNVKGQLNVGGIIGASGDTLGTTILNCYSLGEVNGKENFSELIGWISQLANTELVNCYTKNDTFTAEDLGDAFKDDTENKNNGYPMLYWE